VQNFEVVAAAEAERRELIRRSLRGQVEADVAAANLLELLYVRL
jgi:hypothetical protein